MMLGDGGSEYENDLIRLTVHCLESGSESGKVGREGGNGVTGENEREERLLDVDWTRSRIRQGMGLYRSSASVMLELGSEWEAFWMDTDTDVLCLCRCSGTEGKASTSGKGRVAG